MDARATWCSRTFPSRTTIRTWRASQQKRRSAAARPMPRFMASCASPLSTFRSRWSFRNHFVRQPDSSHQRLRVFCFCLFSVISVCSVFGFLFFRSAHAQEHSTGASEVTRDLLYLAQDRIKIGPSDKPETLLIGESFTYRYVEREGWTVSPAGNSPQKAAIERKAKRIVKFADENYTLAPASDDDRATLALLREGDAEPLVTAVLWGRDELAEAWLPFLQRERKGLTPASLLRDLQVGDPFV